VITIITLQDLKDKHACYWGAKEPSPLAKKVEAHLPCTLGEIMSWDWVPVSDREWVFARFAEASLRKTYEDAVAPLRKTYEDAEAPLWKTYLDAVAPLWKTYEDAEAPLWKTHLDAKAPLRKTYETSLSQLLVTLTKEA